MDANLWIGLALGALIGLATNLIANYITPSFNDIIDRQKAGWIERNRTRALQKYKLIQQLKNGTIDSASYFAQGWALVIAFIILITWLGTIVAIRSAIQALSKQVPLTPWDRMMQGSAPDITLAVFIVMMVTLLIPLLFHLSLTTHRVNNFAEYSKAFQKRWGSVK